jgi:hypothetical protein
VARHDRCFDGAVSIQAHHRIEGGTVKTQIKTRVTAVVLGLAASAIVVAPALARPAASFYTPQQLEAMSANWAAKGRLLGNRSATSFYTPQQLEAMSANWAAKGRLLGNRSAASFYTPQQLEAMSSTWAAKGRLLRRVVPQQTGVSAQFNWRAFGIGATSMLGALALLAALGGIALTARRQGGTLDRI